jgi:pimeloyl-ACP methyl ester carboxylesterase
LFDSETWRGDVSVADDVAAVLDALGIAVPVVQGGISMGGYVR